ncbi:Alpha-ketoglutarate-dependent dioxygenase alkB [Ananas comosus]|uniref:Alpha-ketoglutarate-dependent dioxygenase alkB n=1 Tax=Ananas comosus TaxID=4615 RepID=A0A199UME8_ANACO|nr:Alpha-ketoglutarate-dependent dioxygenase alkB [Ananas comosus]
MSSRLRGFEPTDSNPNPNPKFGDNKGKGVIDLGNGSEVIHIPRFVPWDQAWEWYEYLDKEIPWTRPMIHVFGRSCVQPRDTCYIASEGLPDLKYSGYQPYAHSWDDYPLLKDILKAVHEALPGSYFNSLVLNRYKGGSDYVSWHSDDEPLYGPTPEIASVTLGCEREFLLRRKPFKRQASATRASGQSLGKRSRESLQDQHSFVLKHGSLLVMRGYAQRDWHHSVPKRAKAESVRINLTFRRVLV